MHNKYLIIAVLAALPLAGCIKNTSTQGYTYQSKEAIIDNLNKGNNSKSDILRKLGAPSSKSAFGAETWYYIFSKSQHVAFFSPEVIEQRILAISFDKKGRMTKLKNYGQDDIRELEFVSEKTKTEGHDLGLAEQLLGNIGKFNPNSDALDRQQGRR
jgi:outer membrane protein assembly factor BamE (lipoprotein component of BamABCDE complex)